MSTGPKAKPPPDKTYYREEGKNRGVVSLSLVSPLVYHQFGVCGATTWCAIGQVQVVNSYLWEMTQVHELSVKLCLSRSLCARQLQRRRSRTSTEHL